MANTNDSDRENLQRKQKSVSPEEAKHIGMGLRGAKKADEQEESRGVLGSSPESAGTSGGRSAREIRAEQEDAAEQTNTEGRSGGRSHH